MRLAAACLPWQSKVLACLPWRSRVLEERGASASCLLVFANVRLCRPGLLALVRRHPGPLGQAGEWTVKGELSGKSH